MLLNQSRNYRSLNISALLASGEFLLDDNGYLVAIGNGTRYRLPSGPPEGRASGPYQIQPILPGKNQQLADSAVDWLDPTTLTTTTATSTAIVTVYSEPPGSNLTNFYDRNAPEMLSLSLGLAACSLAILINLVLIIISCWYQFCGIRRRKRGNTIPMKTLAEPRAPTREKVAIQPPIVPSTSSDSHSSSVSLSSDDSPQNQHCSRSKKNSSMHKNQANSSQTFKLFINNPCSCLSIGLHIGLLGFLLAFVHLLVSSLNLTRTHLSSVLCLFITSIAMDTIYCVLFNLITCLLCLILIGYLYNSSITCSSQQKLSCLTLSHSLPWALAAGSALFITLKPSNSSGRLSIFLSGFHFACVQTPQPESTILTSILLVAIPLIGEFIVIIFFLCCCKRLPGKVCFLSVFLPVINAASFIPVLVVNLRNLLLLPLILNPFLILLLYRLCMSHEKSRFPEFRGDFQLQSRSPLHPTMVDMSASMSSDVYFPQTILAVTPHRCNHSDDLSTKISPKSCPHYPKVRTRPQDCTIERRSCNELLQSTDVLPTLSETACISTNPATAAVMAATAAAAAAATKTHHWSPITNSSTSVLTHPHLAAFTPQSVSTNPTFVLHAPSGVIEAASLDRRIPLPIFLATNGKAISDGSTN